ncbi:MAG: 50S ribosomal protein L4 [Dehalococcoidia bacterium]
MQLPVLDTQGTTVGTLEVSDLLLAVPMNMSVVHQAMVRQRANARSGTSSSKTRGQVSGGGAKPRPQKHTGRARAGTIRAPHWRGGGITFGPSPRSFRQRMPKKMRRLAIRCVLSDKVRENQLTLVQALEMPQPKTQEMKRILQALEANKSVLLVTPEADEMVIQSAKNLEKVRTLPASNLNVLDILDHDRLIMTVEAIRKAEELWGGGATVGDVVAVPAPTTRRRAPRKRTPASGEAEQSADTPSENGGEAEQPADAPSENGEEA